MRVPPGSQLVFDQVLASSSAVGGGLGAFLRSDPKFNDWLGRANDSRIFVVADSATAAGTVVVGVEEAGDEELAWFINAGEGLFLFTVDVPSPGTAIGTGADVES